MDLLTLLRLQWDRVGAWVCAAVGAVVLFLGYGGISNTPHVAEQLPYIISAGLTGIFLLGIAGMLWLSADMRDEWRELHAIRTILEQPRPEPEVQEIEVPQGVAEPLANGTNGAARRTRRASAARSRA
jgi:hypothetical protein